ncbi:hypothetical protein ABPG74_006313 [Tetrahymena malaccensis]
MTVKASTKSKSISDTFQFDCNNNIENIQLNLDLIYATQVFVYIFTNNVSGQLLVGIQFGYITCQMPDLQIDMICNKNQYFDVVANQCVVCDPNCAKCSYQGICLDCVVYYYLNQNKCIYGDIPTFTNSIFNSTVQLINNTFYMQDTLLHCQNGYQLDNQQQCVICPNIQGQLCTTSQNDNYINFCNYTYKYQLNDFQCSVCTNGYLMNNFCVKQCPKYYQPDSQSLNCTSIGIPNCIQSQNSYCQQCDSSFSLNSQMECVTISCPQNCTVCVTQDTCNQCNPGYYLQNNNCYPYQNCQNNIVTKNNISVCQVCDEQYFTINPDKTCTLNNYYFLVYLNGIFIPKSCQDCLFQQDCQECFGSSPCLVYSQLQKCMSCDTNYILNNNGQCQKKQSFISVYNQIVDYCINYDPISTQCTSCLTGYYVSSNGVCLQCLYRLSDTNSCAFTCPSGYFSNSQTYICQKCQDSNCSQCDSTLTCQSCNQNFHLFNSVCYQDSCLSNQYRQSQNQICQNCYYRCASCDQQGVSSNICLTCQQGLNMGTDGICHICQNGYTYDGDEDIDLKNASVDINKCKPCDSSCKECEGVATNCTVCQYTLTQNSQDICVSSCPQGYYQDTTTTSCVPCSDPNCSICDSTLTCQTCDQNFHLFSSVCYQDECLSNQYRQSQNQICQNCYYRCATCDQQGVSGNICLTCQQGLNMGTDGICHICQNGYFYDGNEDIDLQNASVDTNKCKPCDSTCKECEGVATNCTVCQYTLTQNSQDTCVSSCPQGYYQDTTTTSCVPCSDPNCSVCDSTLTCQICDQNFHLFSSVCYQDSCLTNQYRQNQNQICQNCYYRCATCDQQGVSGNICLTCQQGLNMGTDGICHICQNGYFYDGDEDIDLKNASVDINKCKPCDSSCKECQGVATNCTVCQYILTQNSQDICVSSCPKGYYQDTTTNSCVPCSDPNCTICDSTLTCQICDQNFHLFSSVCYQDSCLSNQYRQTQNQICQNCYYRCATCNQQGVSGNICLTCQQGLYMGTNGICHICQNGYFYDGDEDIDLKNASVDINKCKPCDSSCEECEGVATNCTVCQYTLTQNSQDICVSSCPKGYYQDTTTNSCVPCSDPNCTICDSTLTCQTCDQNFHLFTSVCYQDSCLSNQYRQSQNQICQDCYYRCATCDQQGVSGNICLTCQQDLNMGADGICHICQNGYFYDGNEDIDLKNKSMDISKCKPCDSTCIECEGVATNCTVCQYTLTQNSQNICVSSCPQGYYQNTTTTSCVPCSDPNCSMCNYTLICTQCNQGYVLNPQQMCSSTCPIGYYNQNQICEQCQTNCTSCLSLNSCITCEQNYDLINGQCYLKCSKQQYRDEQTLKCMQCDSSCLSCNGPQITNCLSCSPKLTLNSLGKCQICDEGEFYERNEQEDIQNGTIDYLSCKKCDSSCQQCDGSTKYDCIICVSGLNYDKNSKLCIKQQEIDQDLSNQKKCQNLQIQAQNKSDCESQLEQIDLLANLNQISSISLVSGGFFLSIFVPQIGCMMWFYLQTQQMRGNTYFTMPFIKQGVSSYFLENSYLHNIFVIIKDPIQESNPFQFQHQNLLNGVQQNQQSRILLDAQSLRSFFIENCMYQSFILVFSFLIIPILFYLGKNNQTLNSFYNYSKWNLPIRACMLCSNFIIISALINIKNLRDAGSFQTINIISITIFSAILGLYVFMMVKCIILIYFSLDKYEYQVQYNFCALIGQLKDKNRISQSFWLYLELKKVIQIFILLLLENQMVNGWICLSSEILFLVYLVSFRPFISMVLNYIIISLQLVQASLFLIFCILLQKQADKIILIYETVSIAEKIIGLIFLVVISVRSAIKYYNSRKMNMILQKSQNMTCELMQNIDNNAITSFFEKENIKFQKLK